MITSLRLEKFGRFTGKSFDFAPVTLFSGPNEAGKTTLFDALFDIVSAPKGNTVGGKMLAERYGKDRQAIPEFQGEAVSVAETDFLNFFAIRSGEIDLDIGQESQCMNRIKASLFSGGIDPNTVAEALNNSIKGKGKGTLNKEAETINGELEKLKQEEKNAEAIRQSCLEEEKRIAGDKDRNVEISAEIKKLSAEIKELEESLNQQALLRKADTLNDNLTDIQSLQRMKTEQEKYARFDPAKLDDLKNRENHARFTENEAKKAAALEEDARRDMSGNISDKERCEAEKSRRESEHNLAEFLQNALIPREKLLSTKTRGVWKKPLLVTAGILLLAGAIAMVLVMYYGITNQYSWLIMPAAAAAAGLCVAFSHKREVWEDTSRLEEAVQSAREQWKNKTGKDPGERYDEILGCLAGAAERARAAEEAYNQALTRISQIEQKASAYALQKKQNSDTAEAERQQLRKLLDETGALSIDDYAVQLEKKRIHAQQCGELEKKLEGSFKENDVKSVTELQDVLNRKINEINSKITASKLPESDVLKMENKLEQNKTRLSALLNEQKENIGSVSLNQGNILGQLKGIPEKIVECKKEIIKKETRLAEIKKEKRALEIAKELFATLADDSSLMLEQLSGEISESFSELIDNKRSVIMDEFSADRAEISDVTGSGRNKELLSAGTRDAFLLAARLVLAKKSLEPQAASIIVLDEPFLTLDRPRTGRALAILEKFQKDTGLQIVIFTKDEETENQARNVFGRNLRVHKL